MEKLLSVLFLALSFYLSAQDAFENKHSWMIETELFPIVNEFVYDAELRGVDKSYLIERVDYIYFNDLGASSDGFLVLGVVGKDMRGIYLNSGLSGNYEISRLVLYHEMGHILSQSGYHSCYECYDIMSSYLPEDLELFSDDVFWENRVDEYFTWLKN